MIDEQYNAYDAKIDSSQALVQSTTYDSDNQVPDKKDTDVVIKYSEDQFECVPSMEECDQNISQLIDHTCHKMEIENNNSGLNRCNEWHSERETCAVVESNDKLVHDKSETNHVSENSVKQHCARMWE